MLLSANPYPTSPERYDEELKPKERFDNGKRSYPDFQPYVDRYGIQSDHLVETGQPRFKGIKTLRIAEINLKARNMVGLLIGSMAQDTGQGASEQQLARHRDVDVLILQTFGQKHPGPTEGGVDWWVRPKAPHDSPRRPMNGNVALWYDISLQEDAKVQGETTSRLWDSESPLTHIRKRAAVIPAGLYRPSPTTMEQIVDCATSSAQYLRTTHELASNAIELWNQKHKNRKYHGLLAAAARIENMFLDMARQVQTTLTARSVSDTKNNAILAIRTTSRVSIYEMNEKQRRQFDKMCRHRAVDEMSYSLERQQREAEGWVKKFGRDYSYLLLSDDGTDGLLPMLPHERVKFTPLGSV